MNLTLNIALGAMALALLLLTSFLAYIWIKYSPVIVRIFEGAPVFRPLRMTSDGTGEEVTFPTSDGVVLNGTYFSAKRSPSSRRGVVVFCHEYLGDRWSVRGYVDHLRNLGFDVFSFDFRNHGDSECEEGYRPLQWVSDREGRDLRGALAYLRSRDDADPAGFGLFGVSRGGSAALCVAADDPTVWGVVTDGAFPTRGTMMAYIHRWADIYVVHPWFRRLLPDWVLEFAAWTGRMASQFRMRRTFLSVESAAARLAPRPWLMIHGEKDNYIGPEIAERFFSYAKDPKELWLVEGAKHNQCREAEPEAYRARVANFFSRVAPRRLSNSAVSVGHEREPMRGAARRELAVARI